MNAAPIAIAVILRHLCHPFPAKTYAEPDRHTTVRLLLDQRVNQPRGFLGTGTSMPADFFIAIRVGHQPTDFIPQAFTSQNQATSETFPWRRNNLSKHLVDLPAILVLRHASCAAKIAQVSPCTPIWAVPSYQAGRKPGECSVDSSSTLSSAPAGPVFSCPWAEPD